MGFSIQEILRATGGVLVVGSSGSEITGISIDSRTIREGELFLAIQGQRFDGHRFVRAALKKGARGAVVSRGLDVLKFLLAAWPKQKGERPVLISVADTTGALGEIAAFRRNQFPGTVVAVTGSNGKTTTKDMLAGIFAGNSPVLKSEGTKNNHIGVPLTLLQLSKDYRIAVVEMGMNHRGEIKQLARIAKPQVGIITGVGQAHLGFLGTRVAIARAKCELLEVMASGGTAVVNADHPLLIREAKKFNVRLIPFGIRTPGHFTASQIDYGRKDLSFRINGKYRLRMRLLGEHNVYNALAAWSTAVILGVSRKQIKEALESFPPPPMRMELTRLDGITIINDAYNSNPESFNYALRALAGMDGGKRKILVAGDMLELGKESEISHRRLGRQAVRSGVDVLICAGEYSPATKEGAVRAGMDGSCAFSFRRRLPAEKLILKEARPGDIILIKGSRRMEMEKVVERLVHRFK